MGGYPRAPLSWDGAAWSRWRGVTMKGKDEGERKNNFSGLMFGIGNESMGLEGYTMPYPVHLHRLSPQMRMLECLSTPIRG